MAFLVHLCSRAGFDTQQPAQCLIDVLLLLLLADERGLFKQTKTSQNKDLGISIFFLISCSGVIAFWIFSFFFVEF